MNMYDIKEYDKIHVNLMSKIMVPNTAGKHPFAEM